MKKIVKTYCIKLKVAPSELLLFKMICWVFLLFTFIFLCMCGVLACVYMCMTRDIYKPQYSGSCQKSVFAFKSLLAFHFWLKQDLFFFPTVNN